LQTPFLDLIGLYSNVPITAKLFDHDDPGHSPSEELGKDLDTAFTAAGVWPEAVLSAHVHNYQRFTRTVQVSGHNKDIAYVIAGTGGLRKPHLVALLVERPAIAPLLLRARRPAPEVAGPILTDLR
jgi:hypothetical protein